MYKKKGEYVLCCLSPDVKELIETSVAQSISKELCYWSISISNGCSTMSFGNNAIIKNYHYLVGLVFSVRRGIMMPFDVWK